MGRHDDPVKQTFQKWLDKYLLGLDQWGPEYWNRKYIVEKVIRELQDKDTPHHLKVQYSTPIELHDFVWIIRYVEEVSLSMESYKTPLDSPIMIFTVASVLERIFRLADSLQ